MNFPFFIAKRYFFTKNKNNFVNIVSLISVFSIMISTAALILVLSVFNGFESLVLSMYNAFDPHLKVTATTGKTFKPDEVNRILVIFDEISNSASVLEEQVLLKYQEKEYIATLKGVSKEYSEITNFDSLLIQGEYIDKFDNSNVAIIGRGVAYYLAIANNSIFDQLQIFLPNRNSKTLLNVGTAFHKSAVVPVGIFGIQSEIDAKYIITPLLFAQNLSERKNEVSSIEIKLKSGEEMSFVKNKLQVALGEKYKIETRLEQQEFLYKILNTEKLAVFLILLLIMLIATFNIIGSVSMLILDKKRDMNILRMLGCTMAEVQYIYIKKSALTVVAGIAAGLFLGLGTALLQKTFGFISIGEGSFVVNAYPIEFVFVDLIWVAGAVFIIGIAASWYPVIWLTNKLVKK